MMVLLVIGGGYSRRGGAGNMNSSGESDKLDNRE
jgi:hypothetical protein